MDNSIQTKFALDFPEKVLQKKLLNESYAESDLNDSLSCSLNEDPDFNPYFEEDISASEESNFENETFDQNYSSAFIVFWSCLLSLLRRCLLCSASAFVEKISY